MLALKPASGAFIGAIGLATRGGDQRMPL